jgi:hypothetical protein
MPKIVIVVDGGVVCEVFVTEDIPKVVVEVVDLDCTDAFDERAAREKYVHNLRYTDNVKVVDFYEFRGEAHDVECSVCGKPCDFRTAHLHTNKFIGADCCWDDRLKSSE